MASPIHDAALGWQNLVGSVVALEARTQPGAWLQADWLPSVLGLGATRELFPALLQARRIVGIPCILSEAVCLDEELGEMYDGGVQGYAHLVRDQLFQKNAKANAPLRTPPGREFIVHAGLSGAWHTVSFEPVTHPGTWLTAYVWPDEDARCEEWANAQFCYADTHRPGTEFKAGQRSRCCSCVSY